MSTGPMSAGAGASAAAEDAGFETLGAVEAALWRKLTHSVRDRDAGWRTPVLATVSPEGQPEARILVLRGVDPAMRRVVLYTDLRSAKVHSIRSSPVVSLVFWCPRDSVQLRGSGSCRIRSAGEGVEAAWAQVPEVARDNYRTVDAPGRRRTTPAAERARDGLAGAGREAFALLEIEIDRLDWLRIGESHHRRALFDWNGIAWAADWAVP